MVRAGYSVYPMDGNTGLDPCLVILRELMDCSVLLEFKELKIVFDD